MKRIRAGANLRIRGAPPGKGRGGYCSQYQSVYDAMTTKPSTYAGAQNTMVKGLVDDGVWAKLDVFYVFAVHTNGGSEALINWKNPGTYNATAANSPTFTADQGFAGGTNEYIDTNWNPTSHGSNYTQNSASAFIYSRTNVDENRKCFGINHTNDLYLEARRSNAAEIKINETGSGTGANTDSRGLFIVDRPSSTKQYLYRNGTEIIDDTDTSSGLPNLNVYVLAVAEAGGAAEFCTLQISMFGAGSALTSGDRSNLQSRFETYMDAMGTGVI